jgi:hypothetical protein
MSNNESRLKKLEDATGSNETKIKIYVLYEDYDKPGNYLIDGKSVSPAELDAMQAGSTVIKVGFEEDISKKGG